jgi:hypothetical protein
MWCQKNISIYGTSFMNDPVSAYLMLNGQTFHVFKKVQNVVNFCSEENNLKRVKMATLTFDAKSFLNGKPCKLDFTTNER